MYKIIILSLFIFNINLLAISITSTNSEDENIKDRKCIEKTFDISDFIIINNVKIELNIDHTWREDLDITLTSAEDISVDLSSDNGGEVDNLYVQFDDDASISIVDDISTHTSDVIVERKPEGLLSTFNTKSSFGTWTLKICDDATGDTGKFYSATLEINGTLPPPIENELEVNFRMDECYWMGGANGVTDDVKDSSGNEMHGQSRNKADNIEADAKICRAGKLVNTYDDSSKSDAVYYPNNTDEEVNIGKNVPFSVSAWVYRNDDNKWMAGVIKSSNPSWEDGWGIIHRKMKFDMPFFGGKYLDFFVGEHNVSATMDLTPDTWTHVVGTYDGHTIKIYKNGELADTETQDTYVAGILPLSIGDDVSVSDNTDDDDRWKGAIDEVKVWNRVLTDSEIHYIYTNENSGLNFDGTTRECKPCNGSSIEANSWDLIGVPADSRDVDITVDELFGDDMNGTYKDDWILYKRTYSSTDNSSGYKVLELNSTLDFGQSYWLGSKLDNEWYVDGTPKVDYNSSSNACTADECVEIDLTSASVDFEVDGDDGSGPYRYNMSGFTDMIKPVDWADCRFLIDGTAYTPTDANESGYANKQIWLYNGTGTDKSNSYTTCDDTMNCKLEPFKGFWIELHGSTKGKTVKLLIPKG